MMSEKLLLREAYSLFFTQNVRNASQDESESLPLSMTGISARIFFS